MFLFSKKLVYLLVVVALVFGGERRAVEGLECWDQAQGKPVVCTGADDQVACEAKLVGGKITKGCNENVADWKTADGGEKKIDGSECYCTSDNCNKEKDYCNLKEGGSGGGGNGTGGGGGGGSSGGHVGDSLTSGAVGVIIPPVLAVLFCFLISAARPQ